MRKLLILYLTLLLLILSFSSGEVFVERMPEINMTFTPVANSSCDNPFDTGNIYFICFSQFGYAYYGGINGKVTEQYNISLNGTHNCLSVNMQSYDDDTASWINGYEDYLIYGNVPRGGGDTVQCAWDTEDMLKPSFMANGGLEEWNTATDIDKGFGGSGNFARTSTVVHSGTYAGYTIANASYISYFQILEPDNYTFSFYYNCSDTYVGGRTYVRGVVFNTGGDSAWNGTEWYISSAPYYVYLPTCNGSWQYYEVNFSTDIYRFVELKIIETNALNNIFYIDDLNLRRTDGERKTNSAPNTLDVSSQTTSEYGHNKWTQSYVSHFAPWSTTLPSGDSAIIDKDDVHQTTSSSDNAYRGVNQRNPDIGWNDYRDNIPDYFNRSNGMCGVWFWGTIVSRNADVIKAFYDDEDCLSNAIINSANIEGGYFYNYNPSNLFTNYPTSISLFGGFQDTRMNTSYDETKHGYGIIDNFLINVFPGHIRTKQVNYTNGIIFNNVLNQWIEPEANFQNVKYIATGSSFVVDRLYGTQVNFQPFSVPDGIAGYDGLVGYSLSGKQRVQFRYSNAYPNELLFSDNNLYDGSHVALTYQVATGTTLYRQTTNTTMRDVNFYNTITPTSYQADFEHFCDYMDNDPTMNYTFSINLYNVVTDRADYDYRPAMVRLSCDETGIFDDVLIKGWNTLRFNVLDNNYNSLENVTVTVTDSVGNVYTSLSNSTGGVSIDVLNWYVPLQGGTSGYTLIPYSEYVSLNNYTISYEKNGYITQYNEIIELSEDYTSDVIMPSWIINGSLVIMPGSEVTII